MLFLHIFVSETKNIYKMKNTVRTYTNGISFFTLENYCKTSAASPVNGITFHKEVSREKARFLHSNGALHYIHGIGDRKELKGVKLNRNMKLKSFKIS